MIYGARAMAEYIKDGWWVNENNQRVRRAGEIRRPIIRRSPSATDFADDMHGSDPSQSAAWYRGLYGDSLFKF